MAFQTRSYAEHVAWKLRDGGDVSSMASYFEIAKRRFRHERRSARKRARRLVSLGFS